MIAEMKMSTDYKTGYITVENHEGHKPSRRDAVTQRQRAN